jgi:Domain of unknown function (DUF4293)
MIQRIQTLFLLVASLLSALLMLMPFANANADLGLVNLDLLPMKKILSVKEIILLPQILNILVGALAFYSVFIFNNRRKQMGFCLVTSFCALVLFASLFFVDYIVVLEGKSSASHFTWVAFVPIIQFGLIFIARIFINKDEQLVKSADRLR